jgi:tetratricopeptide (TPR) repeat protein
MHVLCNLRVLALFIRALMKILIQLIEILINLIEICINFFLYTPSFLTDLVQAILCYIGQCICNLYVSCFILGRAAHWINNGSLDKALIQLDKALKITKATGQGKTDAFSRLVKFKAYCLMNHDHYTEEVYDLLIQSSEYQDGIEDPDVWICLGRYWYEHKSYSESVRCLLEAKKILENPIKIEHHCLHRAADCLGFANYYLGCSLWIQGNNNLALTTWEQVPLDLRITALSDKCAGLVQKENWTLAVSYYQIVIGMVRDKNKSLDESERSDGNLLSLLIQFGIAMLRANTGQKKQISKCMEEAKYMMEQTMTLVLNNSKHHPTMDKSCCDCGFSLLINIASIFYENRDYK